jgi:hypothetical protein
MAHPTGESESDVVRLDSTRYYKGPDSAGMIPFQNGVLTSFSGGGGSTVRLSPNGENLNSTDIRQPSGSWWVMAMLPFNGGVLTAFWP